MGVYIFLKAVSDEVDGILLEPFELPKVKQATVAVK
jgi:hypothetical protein